MPAASLFRQFSRQLVNVERFETALWQLVLLVSHKYLEHVDVSYLTSISMT